ncbi:Ligand-gated ion channel [Ancylostoma duodenale]|uniref:Ligand-gated ion channel n=1 Tax=Ancylostoma duodenale TaxID=51022 RepID=A0A0C2CC74_9BILA|nr:Ligand-gated ion channel [Ancylostoma duodenale]
MTSLYRDQAISHLYPTCNHYVAAPSDEEFFREFLNDFHRRMSLSQVKKDNVSEDEGAESVRPVHVIVDLEGGYRMRMFLRALDESVLVKKEYHYVFANFEMEDADLASFHYSLINITGFQLFDRMDKKFLQNKKLFEDMYRERISTVDYLPASSAFAHDALLVAASALDRTVRKHGLSIFSSSFSRHQLFNRGLPGLYCRPHEDRDHPDRKFEPFEFGDEIADSIKEVVLTHEDGTLTGRIQFDPNTGWRTNYSATVIEIKPGVNSLNSIKERFQWAQGKGFLLGQQRVFHENRPNTTVTQKGVLVDKPWKLRLNVVTVLVKPFVMLRRSNPGDPQHKGNDRFEGYCIDLLKLLAKNISGFEYNIFVSEGNKYGARQADGSWDGMLGYLLNETADIAVAPLTITQERERAVDFSKPFMTTGISIMIKKPEKQEFNIFSFMEPLGMRIWIFTLCSYVGVSLTIFLVSSFSPYEQRVQFNRGEFSVSNEFSMYNSLWFTLAAFMQQGTDILPKALSGRIASSAWWFFTLIIVSSYTANLAAFLTLEKMTPPIESVEDLANQNKILYGVVKGGSTAAFFEDSTVPLYKRMWDFMQDEHNKFLRDQVSESVFVDTYAEGIDRVRKSKGRYAFLLEETTNNYEGGRKPCNTMKVGQNLNTLGYGIATKIGNPLRHDFLCNMSLKSTAISKISYFLNSRLLLIYFRGSINLAILYLQEKGELKRLENKWWYDRGQCDQGISDSGASSSLNLSKVAGIFYILMCGMVLSMLTALVEFIVRKKKENREKEKKRQLALRQRPVIASACNRFNKRRTKSEEDCAYILWLVSSDVYCDK